MNKRLLVLLITGFLLLLAVPLVQAGGCGCPEPVEVASVDIEFTCDKLTATWSHPEGTESGIILINGSTYDFIVLETFGNPSASYSYNFSPPLSPTTNIFVDIGIFDELGELIAETVITVNCSDDEVEEPQEANDENEIQWACDDGRLTYTVCQPLIVYPVVSGDGLGLTIYLVSRASDVGEFMLYLPAETFDNLPDEVAENCTIDSSNNGEVVVYLLSSGQYQINVGPDDEGKVFAYIFNDLLSAPVRIDSYTSGLKPEILPACS